MSKEINCEDCSYILEIGPDTERSLREHFRTFIVEKLYEFGLNPNEYEHLIEQDSIGLTQAAMNEAFLHFCDYKESGEQPDELAMTIFKYMIPRVKEEYMAGNPFNIEYELEGHGEESRLQYESFKAEQAMNELQLTLGRTLSVWWLIYWRMLVIGFFVAVAVNLILSLTFVMMGITEIISEQVRTLIYGLVGFIISIVWGVLVVRMALRKSYRDFRLALIAKEAYSPDEPMIWRHDDEILA